MTLEQVVEASGPTTGPVAQGPRVHSTAQRARDRLPRSAVLAPFLVLGAVRAGWFSEGDTFWQVQTGREILRRGTVFLTDDFSWVVAGKPWHPNSWAFDVLLALAYDAAGPLGLAAVTVALVTALGVALCAVARALGARTRPMVVTNTLLLVPLLAWVSTRPQTASYTLLPLVLALAARTVLRRGRGLAWRLMALYAMTAVWVNLHLAALAALVAVGAGLLAVLVMRRTTARRLLLPAVGVVTAVGLGCVSSPFGVGAIASALATRDASTTLVTEWAPLWRTSPGAVLTWAAAALAVGAALVLWRRQLTDPLLAMCAAGSAVLLVLGVDAARFSPMALVAALPATAAWASRTDWSSGRWRPRIAFLSSRTALAWLAAMAVLAAVHLPDLGQPDPRQYPSAATVAAIPDGCRVLNEYEDGGVVILRRASDGVRVAIDGRNDVYGATLVTHLQNLLDAPPGALAELRHASVDCLLLAPGRPLVAAALTAGWRLAARDTNRILLLAP